MAKVSLALIGSVFPAEATAPKLRLWRRLSHLLYKQAGATMLIDLTPNASFDQAISAIRT